MGFWFLWNWAQICYKLNLILFYTIQIRLSTPWEFYAKILYFLPYICSGISAQYFSVIAVSRTVLTDRSFWYRLYFPSTWNKFSLFGRSTYAMLYVELFSHYLLRWGWHMYQCIYVSQSSFTHIASLTLYPPPHWIGQFHWLSDFCICLLFLLHYFPH